MSRTEYSETMSFSSRVAAVNEVFDTSSPAYTNVTVRRAFIVWLHCGQANKFRDVCNYYHNLEKLENRLPPERRASSRHHEFNLFTNPPPTSTYLSTHHPTLYGSTQLSDYYVTKVEAIRNDKCVFKLDGFKDFSPNHGLTKKQIITTSKLIRNYCLTHYITLDKFAVKFKQYTAKTKLENTVQNVWAYIQRQLIKDEMIMISNWPLSFSFLDEDSDSPVSNGPVNKLNNQRRLLQSFEQSPGTVKEIKDNPWCVDEDDVLNNKYSYKKPNAKNDFVDKQYRKPG